MNDPKHLVDDIYALAHDAFKAETRTIATACAMEASLIFADLQKLCVGMEPDDKFHYLDLGLQGVTNAFANARNKK